ncbi:NHL repeat-containing protein [Stakelama tenebrarum]|uniref:Uncharacterized protein n=1 Tax=Stakelama tenebrarum TaxID=2711215 RepID=A0A6G6Y799_9SPHN|nr:hypothetical protein [Sphingosinithalassobacter tenebrarum]QIG80453.1 hypothetical protein G5C33_12135 [Sphingosinithalassobacter tenebrarum]
MRLFAMLVAASTAIFAPAASADPEIPVVSERFREDVPIPTFRADVGWPKLPDDVILGQMPGIAVDREDHIWVIHRPNSLTPLEAGLAQEPPTAVSCCRPAAHVLRFDATGNLVASWGGPEHAPTIDGINQWPANVHGIYIDNDMTVWIAGNGDGDHVALNFTSDGTFLRQIGRREATGGNDSEALLGNPADIADNGASVLVADGYINKRIAAFDAETLDYLRAWGAYGGTPDAPVREGTFDQSQATSTGDGGANPESTSFGDIVHCVVRGPDDEIYVCDRRNNRLQLFRETGDGIEFVRDVVIAPETGGLRTASDVAFSPDGAYLYVADMMNAKVWILLRETHEVIGSFGRVGRYPGQFFWLHSVDVDSEGNVYTSEVGTGRRIQRFVFTGLE